VRPRAVLLVGQGLVALRVWGCCRRGLL